MYSIHVYTHKNIIHVHKKPYNIQSTCTPFSHHSAADEAWYRQKCVQCTGWLSFFNIEACVMYMYMYGCSQPSELWFIDWIMYIMFGELPLKLVPCTVHVHVYTLVYGSETCKTLSNLQGSESQRDVCLSLSIGADVCLSLSNECYSIHAHVTHVSLAPHQRAAGGSGLRHRDWQTAAWTSPSPHPTCQHIYNVQYVHCKYIYMWPALGKGTFPHKM